MAEEKRENTKVMWLLYGAAQLSGLMAVISTVAWLVHFRGGYAWQSDPHLQFSWHPTLMILSMIYLYGNGNDFNNKSAFIPINIVFKK